MPPSGVSGMMDDEALIEAEIQQQLQQLNIEEDDGVQWDDAGLPELQDDGDDEVVSPLEQIPLEMDGYLRLLNKQTKAFEEELEECDDLINYKHGQNSQSVVAVEDLELLKEEAYAQGKDPEELRRKILEEISKTTNHEGDGEDLEPIVLAGVDPGPQGPGDGDGLALVPVDERQLAFQREMKEQINNVEIQYRIREERLKAALEEERKEAELINKEMEEQRKQKRQQLEREVTMLAKERLVQQERLEKEERESDDIQESAHRQHQENLKRLTEEIETEQKALEEGRKQEETKNLQRRQQAATKIQCIYRGYSVRKENKAIKEILEEKAEIRKKEQEEEKIQEAEQKIEQRRQEKEKEEEVKRLNMEEKEREQEEKKRKKEEEQREKEEKRRQKEEEKRKKEEQKKLEKERELEEKRRKKEDEEKRKLEEKLKKEEERKRLEAEEERRKEEVRRLEEQKRLEEEKEKERKLLEAVQKEEERKKEEAEQLEIERKQKEEEDRKLQEAIKQREEEEKKLQEAEKQKQKEEKEKLEKKMIKKQGNLKQSAELATPRSSRQDGETSSRSSRHTEATDHTDKERKKEQRAMMLGLPDRAEVRRLQWIKTCIPWSKVSNEPWKLKTTTSKKPSRRPASAKKLEPLDKYIITSAAQVDTLRQVTTVKLQDLPGCDLSTLGQCWGLKYLSMTNCNLVAVDGLQSCKQLQLVHFKHNFIEYVDLKDLCHLSYVNLSHNKLAVIHGLDGCGNLRWLDLSHNRLTRIGGIYSLRRLHTLHLSHNQLISTTGLGDTPTLQFLDLSHNHLQECLDISKLCLLQVLKLTSNNLLKIPDLKNQVLLQSLCLEDNSITCVKGLGLCWFPLLQRLNLSQNSIEHLVNFEVFHLLRDVDVGSNQILDPGVLTKCLCSCVYLEKLGVIDNPALEDDSDLRSKLAEMFPRLSSLDSAENIGSHDKVPPIRPRNSFEAMCLIQTKVFQEAAHKLNQDLTLLENNDSIDLLDLCEIYFKFCDKMYQVAVEYRNTHEYGEVNMTMPTAPSTPRTTSHPRSGRARPAPAVREDPYISPKEMFERALRGESQPVSTSQGASTSRETKITADMVGKFLERDRDSETYRLQKEKSAILIQAAWRGYRVRKQLLANGLEVVQDMSDIDYEVLQELHQAAIKIQAAFRGFNLRNKLEKAIEFARLDDDEDEDFDEVDLGEFNFDENMLDDWKPPETPQIPASNAVLGKPPSGKIPSADQVPFLEFVDKPHPPGLPRKAWRGMDSPGSDLQNTHHRRPPSSLASGTISAMDSHRSALSKKEEQITQEWGFKDNQTAFLMMQRAKKMKYNAERRKKLGKLDPKQRLALFRKLEETTNVRTVVQPSRKTLPRKEYFQARQQEIERKDLEKKVDYQSRTKRTFEWIHTQVGDYDLTDSRINQPQSESLRKAYGSEGNLPRMTAEATSGRPVRLVSPGLDIQSVDSASNYGGQILHNPRRLSAGSEASSTRLPPIKTGSAPSVRGKEKMSWRRKEVNKSIGWGGGKKRSHLS